MLKCYIDMNEHVNNARYLDITDEFVENESAVKRIRVEYKNPLKRGKAIKALVYTDEAEYLWNFVMIIISILHY